MNAGCGQHLGDLPLPHLRRERKKERGEREGGREGERERVEGRMEGRKEGREDEREKKRTLAYPWSGLLVNKKSIN